MALTRLYIAINIFVICNAGLLDRLRTMRTNSLVFKSDDTIYKYLDTELWKKTELHRMVYKPAEDKFVEDKLQIYDFKYGSQSESNTPSRNRRSSRRSIAVFELDERLAIHGDVLKKYPFTSVVSLANGCTGTLISQQHVLTSAHCVHNRTSVNPPVEQLRIGLLNKDGSFDWFEASEVHVPDSWKTAKSLKCLIKNDYAVIKLAKRHYRRWMPFGAEEIDDKRELIELNDNQLIQFAGYPVDKPGHDMWYSVCTISKAQKHLLVTKCDASPGMSGSGVYVYYTHERNDCRTIVGVVSSYVQTDDVRANVFTRLTRKKVEKICGWIGAGNKCEKLISSYNGQKCMKTKKFVRKQMPS